MKNGNGKTAKKTAKSPRNGQEIPLGAHDGNTGGKKGRSGRRPLLITQAAREIFDKHRLLEVAAGIAVGRIGEEWYDKEGEVHYEETRNGDRLAAIRFLASYAFGQAPQRIEHTGEEGGPIEVIHGAREQFEGRMARLASRLGATGISPHPN